MQLSIYKPGQGYYTRVLSYIGAGTLSLAVMAWLMEEVRRLEVTVDRQQVIFGQPSVYIQAGVAVTVLVICGILVHIFLNKPKFVDFFIATETEMKKVNWPSKKEVVGSTWVVIAGTFLIAGLLALIDLGFGWFFKEIGIIGV